jgi:tripartite ATP-independent transporter DctP family solute receptor
MKKKLVAVVLTIMMMSVMMVSANAATTLKFCTLENEDHSQGVLLKTFKEKIEELSGGRIQVDLFFNGSLYTQNGAIPALKSGELEMNLTSLQQTADYLPSIAMFASTYMFKGYDHMRKVMDSDIVSGLADQVKEAAGYYPIGWYYNGSRQLNLRTDKEVTKPEDLAGIVLRMPDSEAWIAAGESLGAKVTPLAYAEVYTALQTGTIDAQDNPMLGTKNSKFYEVTKQISLTYHIIDFGLIAVNNSVWDSLTEEEQGWMREAAAEAVKACDATQLAAEAELIDFFKAQGLKIVNPDIDAFAEHAHAYYTEHGLTKDWDMELYDVIQGMAN